MSKKPEQYLCTKCGKKVEKDALKAMSKLWHSSCFTCVKCNKCVDPKVVGKPFYDLKGKPYCESDYNKTFDKCFLCQKLITDRKTTAEGKNYHTNCFKCCVCMKSMEGQTYHTDPQSNIYCVDDYQKKFAIKCLNCCQPIVPEVGQSEAMRIQLFGNSYHINCFKCEECKSVLNNDTNPCFPSGRRILCQKCFQRKQQNN